MNSIHERMKERYLQGEVPWDDALPPPEVMESVAELAAGRALDLGCGYGRSAIYMAGKGWQVDAVDFVEEAIVEARRRAEEADVVVDFHVSPVTELDFLMGPYDLAIDVGCAHSLGEAGLIKYWDHLKRLLRPGALLVWFVRLSAEEPSDVEEGPGGVSLEWVSRLGNDGFRIEREEIGHTEMIDGTSWSSAWFWLKRV